MSDKTTSDGPKADVDSLQQQLAMLQKYNINLSRAGLAALIEDPARFGQFSANACGILYDYSRVRIDQNAMDMLLDLASSSGVAAWRASLFAGERVNITENRPAMHMALRTPELHQHLPGDDASRLQKAQEAMLELAATLHRGQLPNGGEVTNIIHVGIGGSLLGTRLVYEALGPGAGPAIHFVGSVDAHLRERLMRELDPASTVVILVSKSFGTPDTLIHGKRLRRWLEDALGEGARERMFAVSGSVERAEQQGVPGKNVLYLPDWVGGRYSLWSPVSLSVAACLGPEQFTQMLQGARDMDLHFQQAPKQENLPVLVALIGIWHRNVCGYPAQGVIPYDLRLGLLPSHLQQVIMESTGKCTTLGGEPVSCATAALVFGEIGTDAQHSLFQAFHQGTDIVPLNLIGVVRPDHDDAEAHEELLANMLSQASALARGRSQDQTRRELNASENDPLVQHRSFAGDRPTEVMLLDQLGARQLGSLLALYEHKVFVESVIWRVNAFEQWGVELGKTMAA
ncbi:MAG: glucose-6-phosphate isomerase, partial [Gammaproteobacteria bacterium]|nr:glucose-6-phosphate isomerase [Gammaproteobacteria bacterium]